MYPHPDEDVCIRISGISPAFLLQRQLHRTHHSSKPGFCVPTRADGKYTSHGYFPSQCRYVLPKRAGTNSRFTRSSRLPSAAFAISSIRYKPLRFDHWLYGCATTVMRTNTVIMWNNFYEKSLRFKICYHCFTGFVAVHTCIFAAKSIDGSIIIQNIDFLQIMTLCLLQSHSDHVPV